MKFILAILFFTYSLVSPGHKDRISRPKTFIFILKNMDTVKIDGADKDKISKYSAEIIDKKVDLISSEIIFQGGERAVFKRISDKWTNISLIDGKKRVTVPDMTLNKIPEIHFETVTLLWNGTYKNPFSADYFYLRFDIGKEKAFNEYPQLELFFADSKYTRGNLTRPIDENTSQDSGF
jgi:hypothetical protein